MKKNNTQKKGRDLTGVALFHIAKDKYKQADEYAGELKEWLIQNRYDEDDIDNHLWEAIINEADDYNDLIKSLNKKR